MAGLLLQSRQETQTSADEAESPSEDKSYESVVTTSSLMPPEDTSTESHATTSSDDTTHHLGESKKLQDEREASFRPSAIPSSVSETLKRMRDAGFSEEDLGTAEYPRLSFWDFGGQATYYGTHHCFITHLGIYILVMSLLQKLSDPVPKQDHKASVDNLKTGGDYLDHWLNSVRSHTQHQNTRKPPAILVLTHKDMVSQKDIEDYKEEIWNHIKGKAAGKLVMPEIFAVDNTTDDSEINNIREYIREVVKTLPHMGEEIPISWLHLKSKLKKQLQEGGPFCDFQQVAKLARDPNINITDEHTLAMVLTFLHDRGDIIFLDEPSLRDDVTLRPQVMIDVFKTIITVPEYQQHRQTDPEVRKMWERLEKEGVLSDKLLTRIWEEKDQQLERPFLVQRKTFLKNLMEKYYLLCNATFVGDGDGDDESQQEEMYFVPALLNCERNNEMLYPSETNRFPQALYFVFSEKFLPSGMFSRLQALCVRRFGLAKSCVYAGCARFPTDNNKQSFVVSKVNHYLKVELLSSSDAFTEGLSVRKFLSSALFEIKEKWIPCIQYKLCCCKQHDDRKEPDFLALATDDGALEQDSGIPSAFRDVWMTGSSQPDRTENSGGDGPVILLPTGDPSSMRTIGPVLDTMELGTGLSLDQCDRTRNQLTPKQRVQVLVRLVENRYLLGAAVEMCCPEFIDCFLREERGKELAILHTDDYTTEFVLPLQAAASASGVPCHTEIVTSTDSITEKTVELLLNTNNKMVLLVISPQALHHQHWSNLAYEFPVRNEKLLLPILLYPRGSRDKMIRVLQQRSPVLCSLNREEIEMEGSVVSPKKLGELIQKVVIGEEEENRLYQISKAVGEVWTRLGQELGLEPSVLDDVKGDDNVQTTLQMLKAWRIKTPHGPLHYLPQLAKVLQNIGTVDQAKAVQETYKGYRNGLTLTELSPDMNENKSWSLHLPGEGKYLCKRTGLGVVTPYPLDVTYRSENWSDYSWPQEGEEWMPVGPLFSIRCEDVEGPVDLLLPQVLHLADETEITTEDLRVVHVVGDSPELLPVTELTSSHAVTRFKKGSKFGVVGKKDKVSSVSTDGLLTAFRSIEDSDLSILNVYIVSNVRSVQETIEQDENKWGSTHCHTEPCQLQQGGRYCLEGKVTNGEDICVSTSPQFLIFENTLDTNKFYKKFRVEVSTNIWSSTTSRLLLELLKTNNDERKPILQLTMGRYKRSCTAEETDSGVSTPTEPLESVRRRLQDTLSTSGDDVNTETVSVKTSDHSPSDVKKTDVPVRRRTDDGAGLSGMHTLPRHKVHVEEYFDEVISKVSYKWDELARKLGFDRGDIKAIETTVSLRDPDQRCREILERWSNKHASEATLQDLQQALIKIGERRTAEDLKGISAQGQSSTG
ncbi:uncharacterized protein LOC144869582 isoform X2 [Branchiostoma floridae x Branchiostoma japonicum]